MAAEAKAEAEEKTHEPSDEQPAPAHAEEAKHEQEKEAPPTPSSIAKTGTEGSELRASHPRHAEPWPAAT